MIYLTSDNHFGHRNIQSYCGRPFDHEERMWNGLSILKPDDVLIHLGDFGFQANATNRKELWEKFCSITKCKKYLVEGNHDKRSKIGKMPWHAVIKPINQPWTIYRDGIEIKMKHRPLDIPVFDGIFIHGHVHETNPQFEWIGTTLKVNVCVEVSDYKPVGLDYIMDYYRNNNEKT